MDFFRGVGNFFQGLFGRDDDEEKKRRQRQNQQKQVQQPKPRTQQTQQQEQRMQNLGQMFGQKKDKTLDQFSQSKPKFHLNQPKSEDEDPAKRIPGFRVMNPETQAQALRREDAKNGAVAGTIRMPNQSVDSLNKQRASVYAETVRQKKASEEKRKKEIDNLVKTQGNTRLQGGKTINGVLSKYNESDAWEQARIMRDLEQRASRTITNGNQDVEADRNQASILLAILDDRGKKKNNKTQKAVSFGSDIVTGTVNQIANLGQGLRTVVTGKSEIEELRKEFEAGRINEGQYIDRANAINARLAEFTGSLTGEDKGTADRILRSIGNAADVSSVIPVGGAVVRGGRVATRGGSVASQVARDAAENAAFGSLGSLRSGVDTNLSDVVTEAALGGVLGGGASALGAGATRVLDRINRGANLTEAEIRQVRQIADNPEVPANTRREAQAIIEASERQTSGNTANTSGNTTNRTPSDAEEASIIRTEESNLERYLDENPDLTPEQVEAAQKASRERIEQLTEQLKASRAANEGAVGNQAEDINQNIEGQREVNQAVAEQQAQSGAPAPGDPVNPDPGGNPEVQANDAYQGVEDYGQSQRAKELEAEQNPWAKLFNRVKEAIVDPRTVQQKYENADFRRQRANGELTDNQRTLESNKSYTQLQGRIENPAPAAQTRMNEKVEVNGQQISVTDIIKRYGADKSPRAREFANYRLFKDELERIERGADNTLGVDPNEMQAYVNQFEADNPNALADNAVLRAFALNNMRRRVEAGIDSRELYEEASKLDYYSPRIPVSPDDVVRPTTSGFISRTPRGTQLRSDSTPVSHSPLSLYYNDAVQTERAIATQQRAQLAVDAAKRGEDGFNVEIDAEQAIVNRDALRNVRDLADRIASMKVVRKGAKKDAAAARQAEATRAEAANFVRQYLLRAMPDSQFGDIAPLQKMDDATYNTQKSLLETDYARSIDAVNADPMTDAARKQALKDVETEYKTQLDELNRQHEGVRDTSTVATMTDDEALDLLEVMSDANAKGSKRVAGKLAKQSGLSVDDAEDFLRGVQNEIKEMREQSAYSWYEAMETSQHLERDVQTLTYMVDGVPGKVKIPADLADELRRNNELVNRSGLEKFFGAVGQGVKVTWTGALAPVFRVLQSGKNLALMYRNADGLSGIDHRSLEGFVGQLFRTDKTQQFKQELVRRGAAYENALQSKNVATETASDIAARANLITFFNRNPVKSIGDIWKGINNGMAYIDNAQRTAVANGAYYRALRNGATEQQALELAAQAPAKVFGDFNRISRLAQNMEVILPYSGAIQAGARAMAQATRQKPLETIFKDATILAGAGGFAAYSIANNAQYYQDMIDSNKEYELDNNLTLVLPGATRDENGNWSGVVKVPLTPDLRPFNRAAWRSVYDVSNGDGIDPAMIAGEIFNEFTGDVATSVYDEERTDDGKNPLAGLFSGSPAGNMLKIGAGVNPRDGSPLADEFTASRPRTEQTQEGWTTDTARALSGVSGGVVTPLQVDAILDQMGNFGDTLQNREDDEGKRNPLGRLFDFPRSFRAGKGLSEKSASGRQYYADVEAVAATIDDPKTFREFQALHSKKTEDQKKNLLTSATKASQFMSPNEDGSFTTTALFEAEKEMDRRRRARGETGNPLFDLAPQALQKVLTYRSGKIYNAAKQNYTRNGEGAFTSLGLDEKWYSDFQKAEAAYYDEIFADAPEGEMKTFSGATKPKLTAEQEALEQQYYSLPKGTGERKAFLQANQWLLDHWAATNDFTNEERKALGFSVLDEDEGSSGSGGYGYSRGGSRQSDINTLGELTNFTNSVRALSPIEAQAMPQLQQLFAALQAQRSGGRSKPPFGASSRGQG